MSKLCKKSILTIIALILLLLFSACTRDDSVAINFVSNGGSAVAPLSQEIGTPIEPPNEPIREGYTFAGWFSDIDLTQEYIFTVMPEDSITLYAKWFANTYTIIYNSNKPEDASGSVRITIPNTTHTYDTESPISGNRFLLDGWTLIGWSTSPEGSVEFEIGDNVLNLTAVDCESIILYAKWSANIYTISYDSNKPEIALNNVVGTTANSIHIYDQSGTLSSNGYSLEDWKFEGWSTTADGSVEYEDEEGVINLSLTNEDTIILFAVWTVIQEEYTEGLSFIATTGGYSVSKGTATASEVIIPAKYNGIPVVQISGFSNYTNLINITIPASVTNIISSFSGTTSLESIEVSNDNPNYKSVDGVLYNKDGTILIQYPLGSSRTSYIISNSVISIGLYAFYSCSNLEDITFESNSQVTRIEHETFYNCSSLISITLPDSLIIIGDYSFKNCTSLTTLTIPNSVTHIESSAFNNCNNLDSIIFEDNSQIISISSQAFSHCSSLTSVIFGEHSQLINIGGYTFAGCNSLKSIVIPNSVISIGYGAFSYCTSMESISISSKITSIDSDTFAGCSSLTSITIPDGVTSIGSSAFSRCSSLTSVTVPDGVTSIGDYAFSECSSLTSIIIPNSIISIGKYVFNDCNALTIYAEAESKPNNWDNDWNNSNLPVIWKSTLSQDKTYVVSFEKNENTPSDADYPYREGYSFAGWFTTDDFSGALYDNALDAPNGTLYARWEAGVFYIITFRTNGGSEVAGIILEHGATFLAPDDPIKDGYNFDGWYSDIDLEINYTFPAIPLQNLVLYAKWAVCQGTEGLVYMLNLSNTYDVVEYTGTDENVIIPAIYNGKSVTKIGHELFRYRNFITSVSLPNSILYIDNGAFMDCVYLTEIIIPESVVEIGSYAFSGCNLENIVIPNGVEKIGSFAFKECNNLISVSISESVNNIGDSIFEFCYNLLYINVDINNAYFKSQDNALFSKDGTILLSYAIGNNSTSYTIPSGVIEIKDGAFAMAVNLINLELPEGLETIGNMAFYSCNQLANITIPQTVRIIGDYAFISTNLESLIIPSSVESIGFAAFSNCFSLRYVFVERSSAETATSGSLNMFSSCHHDMKIYVQNLTSLATYKVASGWMVYAARMFSKTIIDENNFAIDNGILIQYLGNEQNITLPVGITKIGDYAFSRCKDLIQVTINEETLTIGEFAFSNCENLFSISLGGVRTIMNSAFRECVSLSEINFGNNLLEIGTNAFLYCTSLNDLILPDGLEIIKENAFISCNGLKRIIIPISVWLIEEHVFDSSDTLIIFCEIDDMPAEWSYYWNYYNNTVFWSFTSFDIEYVFASNEGSPVEMQNGFILTSPITVREDWFFAGWYDNEDFIGNAVSFPYYHNENITLYAKWSSTPLPTEGLIYQLKSDNTYEIIDYQGSDINIIIPSTYLGIEVTSIANYAFASKYAIQSVVISEGIMMIEGAAFYSCTNIISVYLPNSLTYIGESAFAFCVKLSAINIPLNVSYIGGYAFYECINLASINVDENNTIYASVNGVLFDKNITTLMICPEGKAGSFIIPETVIYISDKAFWGCKLLTEIIIGSSVEHIGDYAFNLCFELEELYFSISVTYLGHNLFEGSENIIIYCEATSNPEGWSSTWNITNNQVVWGHQSG